MYDNYNYPPGADTPDAPWNEPATKPVSINVDVSITLNRLTTVSTCGYNPTVDEEDGIPGHELLDTYQDIERHFKAQHKSILDLLGELAKYIKDELTGDISQDRRRELEAMLADCEGWKVEYIEINDYDF